MEDEIIYNPKNDVIFHALFNEKNKRITESFLSGIIGEEIEIEENLNRYIDTNNKDQKQGIMDLHVMFKDKRRCLVEIQLEREKNEKERFLYYWADGYTRQLERGNSYGELHKTISIVLVDHFLEELKEFERPDTKWKIIEENIGKKILTDHFEMIIIELGKVVDCYKKEPNNKKYQWLLFIQNPNQKEMSKVMKDNKKIDEAMGELKKLYCDREIRTMADLREKAIKDEIARREYIEEEMEKKLKDGLERGFKEGVQKGIKEGIKEGIEQGIEQGIKQGIKQGIEQEKIHIIKNMLKEKMSLDTIYKITGIPTEKIKEIK